jgi:uncharacterized damage-inducible protein DinB
MTSMARLIAHLAWADQLVLESLERSPEPNPDSLELLAHILAAEHVWISRLLRRPPEFPTWPALSKAECARLAERNGRELTDYVGTRTEQDLAEEVTYVNSAGNQFTSRADDILLQIFLHGTYHRGQIARALRIAGQEPNPTDYIAFIRGAPAATRQDSIKRP